MILCFTSRLNPMGLWCALDETYSASGFLYMDDGESIGMLSWLHQINVVICLLEPCSNPYHSKLRL